MPPLWQPELLEGSFPAEWLGLLFVPECSVTAKALMYSASSTRRCHPLSTMVCLGVSAPAKPSCPWRLERSAGPPLRSISRWSGSFTSGARPSLASPAPRSPPRRAAPRLRPARASLLPQLPGTGSLSALAAAAATRPDPTLLLAGAGGGRGQGGEKAGSGGGTERGGSLVRQPSFLSVHLAVGRERQPRLQPGQGVCA